MAIDNDGDTYPIILDCNDNDALVNPGAIEICGDGVDNNCDGNIDEGCPPPGFTCIPNTSEACYTGPAGTAGTGVCTAGTRTCDASGNWSACFGEVLPSAEICDNQDNNCNGMTDEGLVGCVGGVQLP